MAKLNRPAHTKIFGSSALAAELTPFGGSTPSTDIDLILNSTEAERGWGTVGSNGFPPMEWFNALGYGLSYYSAYILQQGIAEWVSTQDYYINSRVIGSDGKEYKSLTGTSGTPNIGKDPVSDSVNWIDSFKEQIPTAINTSTAKTTPVDADQFGIIDSAASNVLKKITWANIKATILSSFGAMIGTATAKTTPVDADIFIIGDSAASNASKKITWANIKAALNSLFAPLNSPAFTGTPTAKNLAYKATPVTITSWSYVTTTITLNVASHTFVAGDYIEVSGLTATTNIPNGVHLVTSVTTTTIVFTYALTPTGTAGVSSATVKGYAVINGRTNGIGEGQVWQDVKASRAVNTTYANTASKPISVSVRVFVTVASTDMRLNIGGVAVQQFSSTSWMPNSYVTLSGIVPPNTNYDFAVVTGGVTVQSWGELR